MQEQLEKGKVKIVDEPTVQAVSTPLTTPTLSAEQNSMEEPRLELSQSHPTSPVDDQILAMEHSRKAEVAAADAKRCGRLRMQRQRILAQAESDMAAERLAREERKRDEEEALERRENEAACRAREASIAMAEIKSEEEEDRRRHQGALDKLAEAVAVARETGMPQRDIAAVTATCSTTEDAELATVQLEKAVLIMHESIKQLEEEEEHAREAAELERLREAAELERRREADEQKAREENEMKLQQQKYLEVTRQQATIPEVPQQQVREEPGPSDPSQNASERNQRMYEEYRRHKRQTEQSLATLEADPSLKQFRFDCKKAINTPVNAITARSSADIRDKFEKLRLLLSGAEVDIVGNRRLSAAAGHPQGLAYVRHLTAKQFVLQGGEVMSSKPDAGFGMAGVIVGIWAEFPDFGSAFLAHLYEACPYLVPLDIPRGEGMSELEHRALLGFKVRDDGSNESRDEYIKRIGGLAALYAAVCTTTVTEAQLGAEKAHPHGLGHVWRWLSSVMNRQPVADVTATLLYEILKVTGHELFATYGPAFKKMLVGLCQRFFPLIKEVTLESGQGAVSRLEDFLQKAVETGQIARPLKALSPGFV